MFPTQSPTRTNIVEANKHLKMMYDRVEELELEVRKIVACRVAVTDS